MTKQKRYIYDKATGTIHDSRTLSEQCNTDQIVRRSKLSARGMVKALVAYWTRPDYAVKAKLCKHCTN